MNRPLTDAELRTIRLDVERIKIESLGLNPLNSNESELLSFYDLKIDEHIETLEKSYRLARIYDSGLKVIE